MKIKKIGRYMPDDEAEMQIASGTQRWTEGSPHSDRCDDTKRQTTSGMRLQKGDGFKAAHTRTKTTVKANLVAIAKWQSTEHTPGNTSRRTGAAKDQSF